MFPLLLLFILCFFLFICRGVLMSNQLSTPNFINMPVMPQFDLPFAPLWLIFIFLY